MVDRHPHSGSPHPLPSSRLYLNNDEQTMKWRALATDYDGTSATHGKPDDVALAALQRFRDAGGKAILVTGRELRDFASLDVDLHPFDVVVAENGGVLFVPESGEMKLLGAAPKAEFIEE